MQNLEKIVIDKEASEALRDYLGEENLPESLFFWFRDGCHPGDKEPTVYVAQEEQNPPDTVISTAYDFATLLAEVLPKICKKKRLGVADTLEIGKDLFKCLYTGESRMEAVSERIISLLKE